MKEIYSIACFLIVVTTIISAQPRKFVLPSELKEVSGLHIDNEKKFWWLTDSGTLPKLYITDNQGCPLESRNLSPIKNIDWEELSADDQGNIYIFDAGNNRNQRRDLKIYIYQATTGKIDSILFQYPDQTAFPPSAASANFDLEGAFWHNDSLHLFSKNNLRGGNYVTKHYVLPAQAGEYTAILRDSLLLKKRVVTAAAISPDGKTVALLAYNFKRWLGFIPVSGASVFLFSDFENSNFLKGKRKKIGTKSFILATQFESLDWLNNEELYIASEQTVFIRPKAKRIKVF